MAKPAKAGRTFEKIAKADTSALPRESTTTDGFDAAIAAAADQIRARNQNGR